MNALIMPRQITPVTLHVSETGSWLRTWGNGAELLIRDEADNGRLVGNPARLSANVHRTEGTKDRWTVRLFITGRHVGDQQSVVHDDVWSLRMVRQLLAYVAADWKPEGNDAWFLRRQAEKVLHAAWMEAADAEIARI